MATALEDTWVGERAEVSADKVLTSTEPKFPAVVTAPVMIAVVAVPADASLD
jgi:hypothetical protein